MSDAPPGMRGMVSEMEFNMSEQTTPSDHVKRYGPVPTSVHPDRQSRLSIWLWVGAAVIGFAMALPDTVFGDANDTAVPISGPVSDFGALPKDAVGGFNSAIGRAGFETTSGTDLSAGRLDTFPGTDGDEGAASDTSAAAGPTAPAGWDRPEAGAISGPESIGGPSQP